MDPKIRMPPATRVRPQRDSHAQQLEAINEVARIATLDLHLRPMLQRITDALSQRFGWPFVACVMVDAQKSRFVCEAVTSRFPTDIEVGYTRPLGSGVVGEVALTERAILLDDVRTYPNYVETMPGALSELCLPIRHGDRLMAILNLESNCLGEFHDALPLLETIAEQLAGIIASARLYEHVQKRSRLMEMMSEVSRVALEAFDLQSTLDTITSYIFDRFSPGSVSIARYHAASQELEMASFAGWTDVPRGARWPLSIGVIGRCVREGKTQLILDCARDPDYISMSDLTEAELAVPIRSRGEVLGVMNLEATSRDAFADDEVLVFEAFADQIAGAIRLSALNERLDRQGRDLAEALERETRLSKIDGLTGTANRRHFDETIHAEWRRAARIAQPLSLLMLDVDCFKAYNDAYGHPAGDDTLRRVAQTLTDSLHRASDFVARYGGEEFAVLLPETHGERAAAMAERLRKAVAALQIAHDASIVEPYITVSIGVVTETPQINAGGMDHFIHRADAALYGAKRDGRNRVSVATI